MVYKKKKDLSQYKEGEEVKDIFVLKFKKPPRQYKNGYMFDLRVGDASMEVMVKYFGSNDEKEVLKLYDSLIKDEVIYIEGVMSTYNDKKEIHATLLKTLSKDEYEAEFIAKSPRELNDMLIELEELIESVKDEELRKLLRTIMDSDIGKEFINAPAAMYKHQNYKHGLLEHSLNVAKISLLLGSMYELDKDLLITGALLHDIGKIHEFSMTNHIRHTRKGELVGHITLGAEIVSRFMDQLCIDEEKKLKVLHIILSHHGNLEYGSPKPPMFLEALAIYLADLSDSQLANMKKKVIEANTEDEFLYTKDFGNIYLR